MGILSLALLAAAVAYVKVNGYAIVVGFLARHLSPVALAKVKLALAWAHDKAQAVLAWVHSKL